MNNTKYSHNGKTYNIYYRIESPTNHLIRFKNKEIIGKTFQEVMGKLEEMIDDEEAVCVRGE